MSNDEIEAMLAKLPSGLAEESDIEHALFADAIERQRQSPFWGYTKDFAAFYATAPAVLRELLAENKRLRQQLEAEWEEQAGADL